MHPAGRNSPARLSYQCKSRAADGDRTDLGLTGPRTDLPRRLGPDETETSHGEQDKFPPTEVFGHIEVTENRIWLLDSRIRGF